MHSFVCKLCLLLLTICWFMYLWVNWLSSWLQGLIVYHGNIIGRVIASYSAHNVQTGKMDYTNHTKGTSKDWLTGMMPCLRGKSVFKNRFLLRVNLPSAIFMDLTSLLERPLLNPFLTTSIFQQETGNRHFLTSYEPNDLHAFIPLAP